jgi:hypothetical protein
VGILAAAREVGGESTPIAAGPQFTACFTSAAIRVST